MATTTTGTQSGLESRETTSLIGSDKVEGTAVYGAGDKRIGDVKRVMIDKISGKVAYAVLSFGGFLGLGEDYYPVPWAILKYDTNLGGYRTNLDADKLKKPRSTRRAPTGTGAARTTARSTTTMKHDPTGERQINGTDGGVACLSRVRHAIPPPPVLVAGNSPG